MEENFQTKVLEQLEIIISPLIVASNDEDARKRLFRALGWNLETLEQGKVNSLISALSNISANYSVITNLINTPPQTLPELISMFSSLDSLFTTLKSINDAFSGNDNITQELKLLFEDLINLLIIYYLKSNYPALYQILVLSTTIEPESSIQPTVPLLDTNGFIVKYPVTIPKIHLGRLRDLLYDPVSVLKNYYIKNNLNNSQDALDTADLLFPRLADLFEIFGFMTLYSVRDIDIIESQTESANLGEGALTVWKEFHEEESRLGLTFMLSSKDEGNLGLVVSPFGQLGVSKTFNDWLLNFALSTSIEGFSIGPNGFKFPSSFTTTNSLTSQLTLTKLQESDNLAYKIGSTTSTRLEISGVKIVADLSLNDSYTEYGAYLQVQNSKFVISAGDGDGFLKKILPADGLVTEFDFTVGWSNIAGLYFEGSAGLEVEIPINKTILDFLKITSLLLSVKVDNTPGKKPIKSFIAMSGSLKLGPFTAVFEKIGLKADIDFPDDSSGNLGLLDIDFGFKSPSGVGLAINTAGIKGGGFLSFDPDNHKYTGVFELTIQDVVSVKVIGIITTRLPNNQEGYSLLLIVMAEFSPINLGFGFTLNGVGGLAAVHRTVRVDELRKGVKDGSLGSILFPEDPVANAPQIIADLERVFPIQEGRYAFGLMAKIGWGTPTLITLDIGLVLELPTPVRVVILGIIRCSLPHEDFPIIKINANFLGVIDFEKKYITFDASLYDSRIHLFNLSGDMALRIRWGNNPIFLLTVGGFHPNFSIPNNLDLPTLSRLTINLLDGDNPRLTLSTYFAITSNTLQFGAKVDFYYQVTENIRATGILAFDVLIHFSPFHFVASLEANIAIIRKNKALFAVSFKGQLEGPSPWNVNGVADFEVLEISYSIDFNKTFGYTQQAIPGPYDVYTEFKNAVQNKSSWSADASSNINELVTIRDVSNDVSSQLVVSPFGILKVSQKVVPLGISLDKFGNNSIASGNMFDIKVPGVSKRVKEMFAAANFFELSDADKLAKPSFEEFDSGVDFSDKNAFDSGIGVEIELKYEQVIIRNSDRTRTPFGLAFCKKEIALNLMRDGSIASSGLNSRINRSTTGIGLEIKQNEYVVSQADTVNTNAYKGSYYQTLKNAMKIVSEDVQLEDKVFISKSVY
ncbi:MAG TPA: hypothetical protein PK753_04120 [Ignavibacteria bacterium]|nr:hypothetical protein [Ignavibacteria bacterium]